VVIKIKRLLYAIIGFLAGLLLGFLLWGNAKSVEATQDKVTICHATASNSNPYIVNQPDKSGDVAGHDDHDGGVYPADPWGDIIPPFTYTEEEEVCGWEWHIWHWVWDCDDVDVEHQYPGKNWPEGQAIWENGCVIPEEPPVDVCPNLEDVQETVPEGYELKGEECVPVEPPCEENCEPPTATESGTPSSPLENRTTDAPMCGLQAPVLEAVNFHILRNGDTAIAKWQPTGGDVAHIYYKLVDSSAWEHAVRDIPNNGYFVITGLGSLDWTFALQQSNGCAGGVMSQEVVDGGTSSWVLFQ
jgi:hypothetical protein